MASSILTAADKATAAARQQVGWSVLLLDRRTRRQTTDMRVTTVSIIHLHARPLSPSVTPSSSHVSASSPLHPLPLLSLSSYLTCSLFPHRASYLIVRDVVEPLCVTFHDH
ncbi:hypothetical protein E2C01_048975 [Portunus trituberculatus]|uniref:Uncharacterized protein n=1 Tax=Portunus trituberculatus TaxID=210409 RepID=A0A5B7GES6_PORTR|nr:hypothetical protein [Portunus trituberculatus]